MTLPLIVSSADYRYAPLPPLAISKPLIRSHFWYCFAQSKRPLCQRTLNCGGRIIIGISHNRNALYLIVPFDGTYRLKFQSQLIFAFVDMNLKYHLNNAGT
jgi:hypothetical protein